MTAAYCAKLARSCPDKCQSVMVSCGGTDRLHGDCWRVKQPPSGEDIAMQQVCSARMHLASAIESFVAVGYGSHVTQPLRDALRLVDFSIKEVAQ